MERRLYRFHLIHIVHRNNAHNKHDQHKAGTHRIHQTACLPLMLPPSAITHNAAEILCRSIFHSFRGTHPVLFSAGDHIILHTGIFLIICIMTGDLQKIVHLMHEIFFFLLHRIFHDKNRIFPRK